jgi:16S rRNA (cytosine967-C5)-methyltransferase
VADVAGRNGRPGDRTGLPARRAALAALRAVDEDAAYSNLAVPAAVAHLPEARDRAFASHLAYDTLRWEGTLDRALGQVVDRPLDGVEPALRRILRLGALQLLRTGVPTRAAVATSVDLAREAVPGRRSGGAAGFVNGVLRGLDRRASGLRWPDPATDPVAHLVVATAHPAWIVREVVDRLGVDEARRALEADNDPPGLTLRAVGERDALIAELVAAGVAAEPGRWAPEAVLAGGADPRRLAAVAEGRAVPQDEASMLVVHATRVAPGHRVLDLCAGPGGKATHLAGLAGASGRVTAVELHPHRAELIRQAAATLGVTVDVRVGDGTDPPVEGRFDTVLVDAPCTGLGVGRRRPEVRWRRSPGDAAALAGLQARLVDAVARHVRPGGHLTYAACTWTREETVAVTEGLLERSDGELTLVDQVQRWPHRDGTDGMYHAVFRRGL